MRRREEASRPAPIPSSDEETVPIASSSWELRWTKGKGTQHAKLPRERGVHLARGTSGRTLCKLLSESDRWRALELPRPQTRESLSRATFGRMQGGPGCVACLTKLAELPA